MPTSTTSAPLETCCICDRPIDLGVMMHLPNGKAHEVCHLRDRVAEFEQVMSPMTRTIDEFCRRCNVTPDERRELLLYLCTIRMSKILPLVEASKPA